MVLRRSSVGDVRRIRSAIHGARRARINHIPGAGYLRFNRGQKRERTRTRWAPRLAGWLKRIPFRLRTNEETARAFIEGMGELHLEVIVDRRGIRVDANVGRPQVAYKETITIPVKAEGRHIRQSGGKGQCRARRRRVRTREQVAATNSRRKIVDGSILGVHPHRSARVSEALLTGGEPGFRSSISKRVWWMDMPTRSTRRGNGVQDRWITRPQEAVRDGANVILEPIMAVEVTTPDEFMGEVIGDLNSRRGHRGMEMRAGAQVVKAFVPLAAVFGYATDLRSATQGRATYSMQFDHYAPLPTAHCAGNDRQGTARLAGNDAVFAGRLRNQVTDSRVLRLR